MGVHDVGVRAGGRRRPWSGASRRRAQRSGWGGARGDRPDPELVEGPKRRRFTAEYKLRVLREADGCSRPGEVGALLRREGLYSSILSEWRKQREAGALRLSSGRGDGSRRIRSRRRTRAAAQVGAHRGGAGEGAEGDRGAGKRLRASGAAARAQGRAESEHQAMIEQTVHELTPIVGTRPACRALGASSATIYRRRRPPEPRPRRPRQARPGRSRSRTGGVLDVLHSERFVDASPAQVWATLLDEGRYLASERTMYRLLAARHGGVRERRDQLAHPPYARPELLAERPTRCGAGTSAS